MAIRLWCRSLRARPALTTRAPTWSSPARCAAAAAAAFVQACAERRDCARLAGDCARLAGTAQSPSASAAVLLQGLLACKLLYLHCVVALCRLHGVCSCRAAACEANCAVTQLQCPQALLQPLQAFKLVCSHCQLALCLRQSATAELLTQPDPCRCSKRRCRGTCSGACSTAPAGPSTAGALLCCSELSSSLSPAVRLQASKQEQQLYCTSEPLGSCMRAQRLWQAHRQRVCAFSQVLRLHAAEALQRGRWHVLALHCCTAGRTCAAAASLLLALVTPYTCCFPCPRIVPVCFKPCLERALSMQAGGAARVLYGHQRRIN